MQLRKDVLKQLSELDITHALELQFLNYLQSSWFIISGRSPGIFISSKSLLGVGAVICTPHFENHCSRTYRDLMTMDILVCLLKDFSGSSSRIPRHGRWLCQASKAGMLRSMRKLYVGGGEKEHDPWVPRRLGVHGDLCLHEDFIPGGR